MPPTIALFLWLIFLLGLLYFDPAKKPGTSAALWVPLIWIFILGSRLTSQWTGYYTTVLEEGNALDRVIFLVLILLALGILVSRSFKWGDFFAQNLALLVLLSFALLSVVWSDFAFVAFKRWFRDIGSYLVILVVVTDPHPFEAVRTLLRRLCYLLIPLSILLIKYYPGMSRAYDPWSGLPSYVGASTSKNMLGVVCLVSGLYFLWDTLTRRTDGKDRLTKGILFVNLSFIAMTLWLLNLSSSATSKVCLLVGGVVIAAAQTKMAKRHPGFLKVVIPVGVCSYLLLAFGIGTDINATVAAAVGRNATLTDRTLIWQVLLNMHTNPLIGTGYESFWLGPRLDTIWHSGVGHINEAHNGYLQMYLNLGLIGIFFLVLFLISSYRTICRRLEPFSPLGSLSLALWTILIFYNVTEAAFGGGLLWMLLLPGVINLEPSKANASTRRRSVRIGGNEEFEESPRRLVRRESRLIRS